VSQRPGQRGALESLASTCANCLILDDRVELEGLQVSLPDGFLHDMWTICNEAQRPITDRVWLELNTGGVVPTKAVTRAWTYRVLIEHLEQQTGA